MFIARAHAHTHTHAHTHPRAHAHTHVHTHTHAHTHTHTGRCTQLCEIFLQIIFYTFSAPRLSESITITITITCHSGERKIAEAYDHQKMHHTKESPYSFRLIGKLADCVHPPLRESAPTLARTVAVSFGADLSITPFFGDRKLGAEC